MSAAQPNLPGNGVTLRIRRDDGVTFAGVTVSPERYQPGPLHAALAAATGLTAAEIGRVAGAVPAFPRQPREPSMEGRGWIVVDFPPARHFYMIRDDGTHLSYGAMPQFFTLSRAVAAVGATVDLTASELERLSGVQAGGPSPTPVPAGFDIYLLWGQSNMQGRVVPNGTETDQAGVFQYPSRSGGPDYRAIVSDITPMRHFYDEYYFGPGELVGKLKQAAGGGRQILLIPCAAAGSQLRAGAQQWLAGNPGGTLYEAAIAQTNAGIAAAQALYPSSILKGIIGLQGESDGSDQSGGTTYPNYRTALANLIAGFRARITGAATVPFIIGGMVPEFIASDARNQTIARAHAQAVVLDNVYYFTGPTGSTDDTLHYNRAGLPPLAALFDAAPTTVTNYLRLATRVNMTETVRFRGADYAASTTVNYTSPIATATTAARLPAGQDGFFGVTLPETPGAGGAIVGMGTGTPSAFASLELAIYADTTLVDGYYNGTQYGVIDHGAVISAAPVNRIVMSAGDMVRFRRAGSTGFLEVSNNGGNSWAIAYSATVSTAALAPFIQIGNNNANRKGQMPFASANVT